ncbi:hypothetical protein HDV00_007035 [Rhizophlyctis rosea]|nr:hypothetical protein HDV00_007035 [Rhizophlyctis rosea]
MDPAHAMLAVGEILKGAKEMSILSLISTQKLLDGRSLLHDMWSESEYQDLIHWARHASSTTGQDRAKKTYITKHKFTFYPSNINASAFSTDLCGRVTITVDSSAVIHQQFVMILTQARKRDDELPWGVEAERVKLPSYAELCASLEVPMKSTSPQQSMHCEDSHVEPPPFSTTPAVPSIEAGPSTPMGSHVSPSVSSSSTASSPSSYHSPHPNTLKEHWSPDAPPRSAPSAATIHAPSQPPPTSRTTFHGPERVSTSHARTATNAEYAASVPTLSIFFKNSHVIAQTALDEITRRPRKLTSKNSRSISFVTNMKFTPSLDSPSSPAYLRPKNRRSMSSDSVLGKRARRVCDHCGAEKTPEWRRGPNGNMK